MNPLSALLLIPLQALAAFLQENKNKSVRQFLSDAPPALKLLFANKVPVDKLEGLIDSISIFWEEEGYNFDKTTIRALTKEQITIFELLVIFSKPIDFLIAVKENDGEAEIIEKAERLQRLFEVFAFNC